MSYGDFYFYPYRKKTLILSFTKKRPNPNVFRPLFIYSLELKFLLRNLISWFFNTLIGSTLFHTLDS